VQEAGSRQGGSYGARPSSSIQYSDYKATYNSKPGIETHSYSHDAAHPPQGGYASQRDYAAGPPPAVLNSSTTHTYTSAGGNTRTSTRSSVAGGSALPFPSGTSYGTDTKTGWLTTDVNVETMVAPDQKGRLENALDNLSVSGQPFLGKYEILSAAYRREGGQGVVQVCTLCSFSSSLVACGAAPVPASLLRQAHSLAHVPTRYTLR
jgi:hypothetical protein